MVPIESPPQMARAEMWKTALLGLFFCVPLGYTLLVRLLHGDADQLAVHVHKEFRFCKPLEPVGCLLIGQRCEILAVLRRAADEERACNHIISALPYPAAHGSAAGPAACPHRCRSGLRLVFLVRIQLQ